MAIVANLSKQIWESWTVEDFIEALKPAFRQILQGETIDRIEDMKTRAAIRRWCMDNQPCYKRYIKEVVDYFCKCVEFGRLL